MLIPFHCSRLWELYYGPVWLQFHITCFNQWTIKSSVFICLCFNRTCTVSVDWWQTILGQFIMYFYTKYSMSRNFLIMTQNWRYLSSYLLCNKLFSKYTSSSITVNNLQCQRLLPCGCHFVILDTIRLCHRFLLAEISE